MKSEIKKYKVKPGLLVEFEIIKISDLYSQHKNIFRIENGKIAEHWDVIEPIPTKENWKNNNGKF